LVEGGKRSQVLRSRKKGFRASWTRGKAGTEGRPHTIEKIAFSITREGTVESTELGWVWKRANFDLLELETREKSRMDEN